MNGLRVSTVAMLGATILAAGCRKTDDSRLNFTNALNTYYQSRPACLWPSSIKFPAQADTGNDSKTQPFDALVDQGLLTRSTAEKKVFIIASRQVTNYDLSDKGRSAWTPDPQQPGYGNLCLGTPKVTSIDSYTSTAGQPGATTTVSYHVGLSGTPGWATAAETQTAFPQLASLISAPMPATAILTDTGNGWAVTRGPAGSSKAAPVDGQVVQ